MVAIPMEDINSLALLLIAGICSIVAFTAVAGLTHKACQSTITMRQSILTSLLASSSCLSASREERNTHSIPSLNETIIVQFRLPVLGT